MKKKRVFVGIKASKALQTKIFKWQKAHQDLPVRFIKSKNLHLTLIPPWYEEDPKDSIEKLKQIQFKTFKITFDKTFINFKNKVIWIESPNPPKKISQIQKKLALIFPFKEKRIFKTHLTIARFKDSKQLKDLELEKINWQEEVSKITLFESKLGRKEANYKVLFTSLVRA